MHHTIRELEQLNIENLFTGKHGMKPYTNGKLDINTLFRKNIGGSNDVPFNAQVLLEGVKKKKQKIRECYENIYKNCCDTIMSANKVGLTDIIFEIPNNVPECMEYKPIDCIKNIQIKLREQKISCFILSLFRIFISWNDFEEQIKLSSNNHVNDDDDKDSD